MSSMKVTSSRALLVLGLGLGLTTCLVGPEQELGPGLGSPNPNPDPNQVAGTGREGITRGRLIRPGAKIAASHARNSRHACQG